MPGGPTSSVAFDRAVEYYDRTRALPPDAQEAVTRLLVDAVGTAASILEIGVGTGRIALPLHAQGLPVWGVDLSGPMLGRLVTNAGADGPPFPLAVADAIRLPFARARFGAVIACHVLHLIPPWQDAVAEVCRVLRPGGVFLVDAGGGPGGVWRAVVDHVVHHLGATRSIGLRHPKELDAVMAAAGAQRRLLAPIASTVRRPLADAFEEMSRHLHAWTWSIPAEDMADAVAAGRAWAMAEFGDLEQPVDIELSINWRAYQLPA